jgi:stress response protein SCP2
VEIDSEAREGKKQNFKCRVYFANSSEAEVAYQRNEQNDDALQQVIAQDLGIQGSTLAFDNPSKPHSVEKLTLQLDSDSSSILCGACLIYQDTKLLKVVHYSDRNHGQVIVHSGDTSVDGKSVHTIKLNMADLDASVTQLFFTLCACGPADLSAFLNPYIALFETEKPDVNLIQYTIAQAGKSQSCVMVRLFRSGKSDWSIQALGSEQWNLKAKVCMAYHHASRLIDAHLKANQSNAQTPQGHGQGEVPMQGQAQQQNVAPPQPQGEGVLVSALESVQEQVEGVFESEFPSVQEED